MLAKIERLGLNQMPMYWYGGTFIRLVPGEAPPAATFWANCLSPTRVVRRGVEFSTNFRPAVGAPGVVLNYSASGGGLITACEFEFDLYIVPNPVGGLGPYTFRVEITDAIGVTDIQDHVLAGGLSTYHTIATRPVQLPFSGTISLTDLRPQGATEWDEDIWVWQEARAMELRQLRRNP